MERAAEREAGRRHSLRRAVRLEAAVMADTWDGTVPLLATNLSDDGLWLESDLPLDIGTEVLVSIAPPRWPVNESLTVLAEVTRVGMFRRRRERRMSGMGLRFIDLPHDAADLLAVALRGLPPPLPKPSARTSVIDRARPSLDEGALPQVVLADGSRFVFRAQAPLLTAGRGPETIARAYTPVVPLTSTMSAIFDRTRTRARTRVGAWRVAS